MTTPGAIDTDEFSRIVHATDFSTASEAAFAHGLRLALAVRGHFYLVHAEHLDAGEDGDWAAFPGVRSTLVRWGLLPVDADPAAVADRLGLRITKADVPDARPTDGVLHVVENNRCNFLVLATHGREGLARLLQGSIAETLARRAQIPTLFLPVGSRGFVDAATGTPRLRNILQPIAAAVTPGPAASLALRLADALGCGETALHALHVGAPEEAPTLTVAPQHEPRLRFVHAAGAIVPSIVEQADALDADLIVMATRGHDGLLDRIMGSTTEQVLRQANRPLLAVPAI
jgi:nucleotide-binding universal stress UspA family protein